jgi:hypothetical protein
LLTGCGTQFAATELNANVPMGGQRPASSVEVFASEPPTRPHVDVRIIEAARSDIDPDNPGIVDQLRAEAGREGCDAIYLKSTFPGTPRSPERASATCVVYTNDATVAARVPAAPATAPLATTQGAILREP